MEIESENSATHIRKEDNQIGKCYAQIVLQSSWNNKFKFFDSKYRSNIE